MIEKGPKMRHCLQAKDDAETAGDRLRDAAYEAKQAGKEAWGEARDKASEAKRNVEKKI